MELTIQAEEKKDVLGRTDYSVRVFHEGATPSRSKVADALAKELKAKPGLLVIRRIGGVFGQSASMVEASVYKDGENLKRFEPAYMEKRQASEEKPEENAAAPESEKPAEDDAGEPEPAENDESEKEREE